jgi:hypothetical protein
MSGTRLLVSATILSVISFPAMAQQVISEPGYCAFFYPNANCQNKGPGNPYTGGYIAGSYQRNYADQGMYGYGYGAHAGGQTVGVAAPPKARSQRTRVPQ